MTTDNLLRRLLHVNGVCVDGFDFKETDEGGELTVHVHVDGRRGWRCPECGCRCPVYDYRCEERLWRGMDFGPVRVWIGAKVPRVCCPEDGVHVCAVPWAKKASGFTADFACSAAWMVKSGLSKSKVSEFLRIDWKTVGRLVELVWRDLEPDPAARFGGLVRIGIDEVSFRKGHRYITTVVNHDTNTVVWACEGFGKEVLEKFFKTLTPEQRASILVVSGDGARWITDSVRQYCPNAERCLDPFHAVEWANVALDAVRVEAWRRAKANLAALEKDEKADKTGVMAARREAEQVKRSKYALGKNPENLTETQRGRLAVIQAQDGPLARAYAMKEQLRAVFKMSDAKAAGECLDKWLARAQRCRIRPFVELQRKVRRHREHILNAIRCRISNARVEALNNKIKLLIRIAYGFRNIRAMIGLVMLFCSDIEIPWPGRRPEMPMAKEVYDGRFA